MAFGQAMLRHKICAPNSTCVGPGVTAFFPYRLQVSHLIPAPGSLFKLAADLRLLISLLVYIRRPIHQLWRWVRIIDFFGEGWVVANVYHPTWAVLGCTGAGVTYWWDKTEARSPKRSSGAARPVPGRQKREL